MCACDVKEYSQLRSTKGIAAKALFPRPLSIIMGTQVNPVKGGRGIIFDCLGRGDPGCV